MECHARAGRCPTPLCGGLASFGTQRALAERAGRARARQAAEVASLVAWGLAISVWAVTAALGLTAIASLLDWAPLPGRTALLVAVGYAVASVAGVALTFHAVRSRTRLRERIASDELEARAGREQRPPGPGPKDGAA